MMFVDSDCNYFLYYSLLPSLLSSSLDSSSVAEGESLSLSSYIQVRHKCCCGTSILAAFRNGVAIFTNYMLISMQKAFSNKETPIGKAPTHYYWL